MAEQADRLTLKLRCIYANALYEWNAGAAITDLREAVNIHEDMVRIARRVFGGTHPITKGFEGQLGYSRAALRARETPSPDTPVERTFAQGWLDGPS